jgi:GT2 family glycosyltransferase/glycosyltransferase involved in cell wall biosynthesis
MVTKLLHVCGLKLGRETDLMPARPDNPDGFWENLRFVNLNDELLGELGGAWDLPPRRDEDFGDPRLKALREKARLLVGEFNRASAWGWKDPRNSLTLPFWKSVLPGLKTVVVVRNPLEVAHSMRARNGTSYSFGVRLWEIYNRRIMETTAAEERLLTQYDFFFENSEFELRRIAAFVGLPDSEASRAATFVATGRRHTHFTMDQLVDAGVSGEVIDFYRQLLDEAARNVPRGAPAAARFGSDGGEVKTHLASHVTRSAEEDILSGTVSRVRASIPEMEAKLADLTSHLARQDEQLRNIRERFIQTNQLLHGKSISLAQSETRVVELTKELRHQLHSTRRLSRLLNDVEAAAARLRSSRRWKMANPFAALKAALSPKRPLPGYGHLEKIVSAYSKWRSNHPEIDKIDDELQALNPSANSQRPIDSFSKRKGARYFSPQTPTEPISFPIHDEVEVSIIIPVYNQFAFTQACLASLQGHAGDERFEVIVVDDCSTDATADMVPNIPGVVYLRSESNSGFIASCNRGAEKARGEFLVFLNNDTEVTPGWLGALRETFDSEPEAGLVGSKLVFPDGRLQEAGGIIWRDASGWNRGKWQNASKPEFNYLREVDYCSAASVMIPKSLFQTLGGFDSKYAPCYYEDTDLAFRVRRHGFKVFYQPGSEVIHYEGATGGTDLSSGAKKYQEINRETFLKTWATELAEKPENGDIVSDEQLKPGQKRILVIDHHVPMPDRDSGSMRMWQILKILHRLGHRVTFLPDNMAEVFPYGRELQKHGIEVIHHPHAKTVRQYLEREGGKFDIVILSRCDYARKHVKDVQAYAPQGRLIFDTVDLHFVRTKREAELTQDEEIQFNARETEARECELIDQSDETWVVSECERQIVLGKRPDKSVEVVSNIVEIPGSKTPFSLRRDFLFIGSFLHPPNTDAVVFFMREIYPLVQPRLPEANFYIIGNKAPPEVIALATEKVIVAGLQPDVGPYFESVKLSIAPLRWGAGVKGKVNQSMAFGVPVVGSSIAVEGMSLTNREHILIADTPQDFAEALVEVYESEELWDHISRNGIEKTKADYSIETATKQLSRLLSDEHVPGGNSQRPQRRVDAANEVVGAIHHEVVT